MKLAKATLAEIESNIWEVIEEIDLDTNEKRQFVIEYDTLEEYEKSRNVRENEMDSYSYAVLYKHIGGHQR